MAFPKKHINPCTLEIFSTFTSIACVLCSLELSNLPKMHGDPRSGYCYQYHYENMAESGRGFSLGTTHSRKSNWKPFVSRKQASKRCLAGNSIRTSYVNSVNWHSRCSQHREIPVSSPRQRSIFREHLFAPVRSEPWLVDNKLYFNNDGERSRLGIGFR